MHHQRAKGAPTRHYQRSKKNDPVSTKLDEGNVFMEHYETNRNRRSLGANRLAGWSKTRPGPRGLPWPPVILEAAVGVDAYEHFLLALADDDGFQNHPPAAEEES